MAASSINEISSFINQQTQFQEKIETSLWKVDALLSVAELTSGFYSLSEFILHNYFSAVSLLLDEVNIANQQSLDSLQNQRLKCS